MKFSLSFPENGTTKTIVIDNTNTWRHFLEKRMGQQVEADTLGEQFKGYVFKITGGYDSDGFAMKQGIFSNGRVRLLLKPGSQGYRATRKGERKRKSVRGCIVGPDIKMLSCLVVKKGDKQIPGLTDQVKPRRLGPKRASGIRKLFGIAKTEGEKSGNVVALIKKNVIRRTFKSKKNADAPLRQKSPKIQRLVTDVRIRRKRIQKDRKVKKWKKTLEQVQEYKKIYDKWIAKRKATANQAKIARKASQSGEKSDSKPKVDTKPADTKGKVEPKKTDTKKQEAPKKVDTKKPEAPKKPEVKKQEAPKEATKKVDVKPRAVATTATDKKK